MNTNEVSPGEMIVVDDSQSERTKRMMDVLDELALKEQSKRYIFIICVRPVDFTPLVAEIATIGVISARLFKDVDRTAIYSREIGFGLKSQYEVIVNNRTKAVPKKVFRCRPRR